MAGRLYRMAKVVSANPASWGIVDANQISGFRTVATQADLYSIAACILSSSYGDGTTTGADAVGQIWHVQDTNKDFRLTSWANRGKAAGWTEELTSAKLSEGITNATHVANVAQEIAIEAGKAASAAQTTANAAKSQAETATGKAELNGESITVLQGTVNMINKTVSGHTTSIDTINTTLANKAENSVVNELKKTVGGHTTEIGEIKKQLTNIDTTLYKLAPNNTLPSTLADINKNCIYLVKAATTGTNNVYAEYIYTGTSATYDATGWEKLGEVTASVDLSGYYTKAEIDKKVTAINKNSISSLLIGKQDSTDAISVVLKRAGGENTLSAPIPVVNNDLDDHHNGLMSPTMLTKLNGIATGANNYTHPVHTAYDSGLYKITVDSLGHVSAATLVDNDDIKSLAPDLTVTQTGSELTQDIKITYKGADHTARLLSATDKQAGLLSSTNKKKLDGIAEGATKNIVDDEVKINGANAVSGKAVSTAIDNHIVDNNNLAAVTGTTYSILGKDEDSETGKVSAMVDSLIYHYNAADRSTLSIDGAAVWDEGTLTAISNTELTKILV